MPESVKYQPHSIQFEVVRDLFFKDLFQNFSLPPFIDGSGVIKHREHGPCSYQVNPCSMDYLYIGVGIGQIK